MKWRVKNYNRELYRYFANSPLRSRGLLLTKGAPILSDQAHFLPTESGVLDRHRHGKLPMTFRRRGRLLLFLYICGIIALAVSLYEVWAIYQQHEPLATSDRINIVVLVVSVVALVIGIASYQDAQASGRAQQKTLDTSRDALKTVSGTLLEQEKEMRKTLKATEDEEVVLETTLQISKAQLAMTKEQLKVVTDKPVLELKPLLPDRNGLSVHVYDRSHTKVARDISRRTFS